MPAITDTQVLIKIKAAGVYHSDIMAFKGQHPSRVPPVITGHEAAGEVAAVGRELRSRNEITKMAKLFRNGS